MGDGEEVKKIFKKKKTIVFVPELNHGPLVPTINQGTFLSVVRLTGRTRAGAVS
jgi:hypothetical protein